MHVEISFILAQIYLKIYPKFSQNTACVTLLTSGIKYVKFVVDALDEVRSIQLYLLQVWCLI